MDITTVQAIANGVIVVLAPALVKVVAAAGGPIVDAGEELAKALGQAAGEETAALIRAISRKFEGDVAAETALADFAQTPEDDDAQASLRHQLKKALQADETFLQELRELLEDESASSPGTQTVTASGERSVAVGRDVNAPIITGDIDDSEINIGS